MTLRAGRRVQCLRVAVAAGCTLMTAVNCRMLAAIFRRPIVCRVASSTIEAKQTRMVTRIPMTARAGS